MDIQQMEQSLKVNSEKIYKYMLDQGPYVIRYENRINKDKKYDVRIFLNNKEVIYAKNEGIPSGKIKYIGTNETLMNKKTDTTAEGRIRLFKIYTEIK